MKERAVIVDHQVAVGGDVKSGEAMQAWRTPE